MPTGKPKGLAQPPKAARGRPGLGADPRLTLLAEVRRVLNATDPSIVEERKWKKPSNPAGVPVFSLGGILLIAEPLKGRLRLTFPTGAALEDPHRLFNTRLDSRSVRAIDIPEGATIDTRGLVSLVRGAIQLNAMRGAARRHRA